MNKRTIIASLNNIANNLDNEGLHIEADSITKVMHKIAQEMMPEDAEASTDIEDANIDERIFTFVNRAMADHNAKRDGWITLRTLIKNDPILNRDKNTFLTSLKAAEKLFNNKLDMIGGEKGKFKDNAGFIGGRRGPDGLPYRDRSPKPGGLYSKEKPVKNQYSYPGGGLP